jgi:hypothetical protein
MTQVSAVFQIAVDGFTLLTLNVRQIQSAMLPQLPHMACTPSTMVTGQVEF